MIDSSQLYMKAR